ncbi:MAG TPA: biotin/lipoyl-containing protein [Herpetosiphonaceae bacterium]
MRRYTLQINGKEYVVDVEEVTGDTFRVLVGDEIIEVRLSSDEDLAQAIITPEIAPTRAPTPSGLPRQVPQVREVRSPIEDDGSAPPVSTPPSATPRRAAGGGAAVMSAPMPGVILSVETTVGATVARGQVVVVLEAMKMKNAIKASRDGVVAEIFVQPGQPVGHGDPLIRFKED